MLNRLEELKKDFDLQLFANDGKEVDTEALDGDTHDEYDTQEETNASGEGSKADDLDLLDLLEKNEHIKKQFQSEVDRMITKAIQTRDKKHQEELKKEKQRANMTAEELQAEKERELQEREEQLRQYELKLAKIDYFKQHDLPLDLVDYVVVSNEEEIEERTQSLLELVDYKVKEEVQNRLKVNGVDIDSGDKAKDVSLDDLSNLSTDEINQMWENVK